MFRAGLRRPHPLPGSSSALAAAARRVTTLSTAGEWAALPHHNKRLEHVYEANKAWRDEMSASDPHFFEDLGAGHTPNYLAIGCADARVPLNEILGLPAGEVFVHRNVGNQVVSTDVSLQGSIQYAVDYLGVSHIVVCGHYDCGAIRAASSNRHHGAPLENWLTPLRDIQRLHKSELIRFGKDGSDDRRHRRLVELSVIEQCLGLFKNPSVQRRRILTYKNDEFPFTSPRIHAMVFDPATGELLKLDVSFGAYLSELGEIYDLAFDDLKLETRIAEQQEQRRREQGLEVVLAAAANTEKLQQQLDAVDATTAAAEEDGGGSDDGSDDDRGSDSKV